MSIPLEGNTPLRLSPLPYSNSTVPSWQEKDDENKFRHPTPWSWPTGTPVPIVASFNPPAHPWLSGNRGVDLDVPVGTTITAPADGIVTTARVIVNRPVVAIQHAAARSTFEPLSPLVHEGDKVKKGSPIGIVVEKHYPGTLHWGAKIGPKAYINPLRLLKSKVILKSWKKSI